MRTRVATLACIVLSVIGMSRANSHHSGAAFDAEKIDVLTGTVTDWQFTNPHCWLRVTVVDSAGRPGDWAFETTAPASLMRNNITKNSVATGDKVTVSMHPLKDGKPGGQLVKVVKADGAVLQFARNK